MAFVAPSLTLNPSSQKMTSAADTTLIINSKLYHYGRLLCNESSKNPITSSSSKEERDTMSRSKIDRKCFPSLRANYIDRKPPLSKAIVTSEDEHNDEDREICKHSVKGSSIMRTGIQKSFGAYEGWARKFKDTLPPDGVVVLMSCAVGVLTGIGVVMFNYSVHKIHDVVWQGIPRASWLRDQPLQFTWQRILLVPVGGGMVVGLINALRASCEHSNEEESKENKMVIWFQVKKVLSPFLKASAAAITLGSGNSLGPEGPSVEIGASMARGVGTIFRKSQEKRSSLIAAGSAAGLSSGFNAAVAGCFFAIESVLRPSSTDSAASLTTTMLLLSSVLASVVSQAGLGSDPAFKIPAYDFRSPAELPLYLLLGIVCGGMSVALRKSCSYATYAFDRFQKATAIPAIFLPPLGGLLLGLVALAYPEVLYWGFENVDVLLESRPWVRGPPVSLLLQLVGAKMVATSICRGSQLVGGIYAPSLFMGAALGSAYGKLAGFAVTNADPVLHLDALKVAAPQAYALVGMAAMLAGVCQVPLTSVLLLFELTQDYRIILPLMAAVGLSSWIASASFPVKRSGGRNEAEIASQRLNLMERSENRYIFGNSTFNPNPSLTKTVHSREGFVENSSPVHSRNNMDICGLDSSLCLSYSIPDENEMMEKVPVSAAMVVNHFAISSSATVAEVMQLMATHRAWCVLLVDKNQLLQGIMTLGDFKKLMENLKTDQEKLSTGRTAVSRVCGTFTAENEKLKVVTASPDMNLKQAQKLMSSGGFRQLPVVPGSFLEQDKHVLGVIDQQSIILACRLEATKRLFGPLQVIDNKK